MRSPESRRWYRQTHTCFRMRTQSGLYTPASAKPHIFQTAEKCIWLQERLCVCLWNARAPFTVTWSHSFTEFWSGVWAAQVPDPLSRGSESSEAETVLIWHGDEKLWMKFALFWKYFLHSQQVPSEKLIIFTVHFSLLNKSAHKSTILIIQDNKAKVIFFAGVS